MARVTYDADEEIIVDAFVPSVPGHVAGARACREPCSLRRPVIHRRRVDASGNLYTANDGGTQVYVFAAAATGDVKPVTVVGGSHSQLGPTEGL